MKRRNINKTIMQRGGLMIEALAMLGLIAVVTPTMYKKSAERTMEVEDINTAATIRTVMNAANDYVSSNYSWLISQMNANGQTVRDITAADIGPFLPYGFNLSQPLHNYNAPILKVKRPSTDSNNLTAFALFPARATPEEGIGQERTSRIAALVGSNGGYKPTESTARGVGGIWNLDASEFSDVFGSNEGNQYSIVTASTDIINSATNNEVDMTKYLQRGSDNAPGTEWKNTMRTDLYMGGPNQDGDIYENLNGPYSIRNIKSLIVGTNAGEDTGNYGLYIAPEAANPNAYVHGSLKAGEGQFKADNANLQFGGTEGAWNFVVSNVGKVMNRGDLELASDNGVWNDIKIGALRNNGADKYLIQGSKSAETLPEGSGGGILPPYDYGSLTFVGDLMKLTDAKDVKDKKVKIMENGWAKDENGNAYEDIKYVTSIASTDPSHPIDVPVPEFPVKIDANTKVKGLLAAGQIDTNKIRTASLSVGSKNINDNYQWMTVDEKGVLIADPDRTSDTATKNRINVNKDQIVLSVDKDAKEVTHPRGDGASDGHETSAHDAQIIMNAKYTVSAKNPDGTDGVATKDASIEIKAPNTSIHGNSTTVSGKGTLVQAGSSTDYGVMGNNLNDNSLLLRNDNMQIRMTDKETVIGPRPQTVTGVDYAEDDKYKVRTTFHKGNLDLLDSNLNILNTDKNPVFSVGTNGKLDGFKTPYADIYTVAEGQKFGETEIASKKRKTELGRAEKYDVAAHGNIIFTSNLVPEVTKDGISRNSLHRTYLSMGDAINSFAAVNIVGLSVNSEDGYNEFAKVPSSNKSNIVLVDQVASSTYNNRNDLVEPGTIYIRKGYLEAVGASDAVSKNEKGDVVSSTAGAKDATGVVVASRFVANNPTSATNKNYGANVPNLFTDKESSNYGESGVVRYDTYMVNPAYTSVMHDIKLTTRGGARLSDVLPDFINKGIYVVTNSYQEQAGNELKFLGAVDYSTSAYDITMGSVGEWSYKAVGNDSHVLGKDAEVWGSPFLGTVPAPQCPPGYGRVITLAPSTFNMGTAGYLRESKSKNGGYFVYPDIASSVDIKASKSTYEKAEIVAGTSSSSGSVEKASISLENSSELGIASDSLKVKDAKNFATAKYVLTGDEHSAKPLTFQQSTWLKTLTVPIYSSKDEPHYVQAWAAIMGFIYPESLYKSFVTESDGVNKRDATKLRLHDGITNYVSTSYYWNIFPVIAKSLEGYATVYCYFDRSNLFKGYETDGKKVDYTNYIDKLDYMKGGKYAIYPENFKKGSFSGTGSRPVLQNYNKYKERLNDPELKYNEVW